MVHKIQRIIASALIFLLILGMAAPSAHASQGELYIEEICINPLYAHCMTEADLVREPTFPVLLYSNPEYLTDAEAAGAVLRQGMKARESNITVHFQMDDYNGDKDAIRELMRSICNIAVSHTGSPNEGDYLLWQYGGWKGSASGSTDGKTYFWNFTYNMTYYTTSEEEAQVDAAVDFLLKNLDLAGATDYQKISTIYDYICKNVSYDRSHLNNASYKRQFTAYAALLEGKAVCQGYALLFYRLALELGLDSRLIPGVSNGENHGWNIVQLGDYYYNADTTWDSGDETYQYFLRTQAEFTGHTRDSEYDSEEFHSTYPMAATAYVPTPADLCSHSYIGVVTKEASCLEEGAMDCTCALCGNEYTKTLEAAGHSYTSQVTPGSCTEDGFAAYTCTVCGDSYTETTPAAGHSWDEGTVIQAPSAYQEGVLEYRCTLCPASKQVAIPKTDVNTMEGVSRISGSNRYKTAFKAADMLKQQLGIDQFHCAVIASGTNFADALSGSYLACVKAAPILLVDPSTIAAVTEYLNQNLAQDSTVYILGGTAAVPGELDDQLENFQVTRLSGRNRYDTNLKILQEAGVSDQALLICTGNSFADSLSASALNRPILLVDKTLTENQKDFLSHLDSNNLYVIGGSGAVNDDLADSLRAYGSGEVIRVSGRSRFDTSIRVAQTFFPEIPKNLVLAYGHNYPDGLCGGVLAYYMNAPLILTQDADLDLAAEYAADMGITRGAVLGGSSLISDKAVRTIFQMTDDEPILKP